MKKYPLPQFTLTVLSLSMSFALLQEAKAASGFDYPELMVAPRASERLTQEAKDEPGREWTTHIPIQISAVTTLFAGAMQFGGIDPDKSLNNGSAIAGVAVGGGWLVASGLLAMKYSPYRSASSRINSLPNGSTRDQLTKERAAEEAIDDAAALGTRLKWMSILSNFGVNLYMASQATSGSFSMVADGIGMGAALVPLLFTYHWNDVSHEQSDYKKRIYGPVATATVFKQAQGAQLAPGLLLGFQF